MDLGSNVVMCRLFYGQFYGKLVIFGTFLNGYNGTRHRSFIATNSFKRGALAGHRTVPVSFFERGVLRERRNCPWFQFRQRIGEEKTTF